MVIVSSDGINDSTRPWLLGIELRGRDPGDLLAIPVADRGWAYAGDLSRIYRAWVGARVDQLSSTTLARLDGALRAALDPLSSSQYGDRGAIPCADGRADQFESALKQTGEKATDAGGKIGDAITKD